MDLAQTIFYVGVGIGAVLVGIGVVLAAVALRPLSRDTRALARDAARLSRLLEEELPRRAAPGEGPGRAAIGSVQSPDAREDEQIA